jgi:hypothetical protein
MGSMTLPVAPSVSRAHTLETGGTFAGAAKALGVSEPTLLQAWRNASWRPGGDVDRGGPERLPGGGAAPGRAASEGSSRVGALLRRPRGVFSGARIRVPIGGASLHPGVIAGHSHQRALPIHSPNHDPECSAQGEGRRHATGRPHGPEVVLGTDIGGHHAPDRHHGPRWCSAWAKLQAVRKCGRQWLPQAGAEEASMAPQAAARQEPRKGRAAWTCVSPKGAARPVHRPGTQLGRPPSAALLVPSAPAHHPRQSPYPSCAHP